MIADSPIRKITQGQELTTEFDEKTLDEKGFNDMQVIFNTITVLLFGLTHVVLFILKANILPAL